MIKEESWCDSLQCLHHIVFFFLLNKPHIHTSHSTGMLFMECCHGDVVHVSEFLNGCLMADCHLFDLTHSHTRVHVHVKAS